MFVNVPTITYSDFFISKMNDEENLKSHFTRKNTKDGNVNNIYGAYGNLTPDFHFNPLLVHEHPNQQADYGVIKLDNIKSKLNRIRKLNKAHYPAITFRGDDEDWNDYMKRRNKAHKTIWLTAYGSSDSPEDIMKKFDFLGKIKDRTFVVSMTNIGKDTSPDFRQHKNGPYIGKYNMDYEYFKDNEPEYVIQYHIYEVEFGCKYKVIETNNFKIMINEDTDRHVCMTVFDKDNSVICYAWREDKELKDEISVGYSPKVLFKLDKSKDSFYNDLDEQLIKHIEDFNNETI